MSEFIKSKRRQKRHCFKPETVMIRPVGSLLISGVILKGRHFTAEWNFGVVTFLEFDDDAMMLRLQGFE